MNYHSFIIKPEVAILTVFLSVTNHNQQRRAKESKRGLRSPLKDLIDVSRWFFSVILPTPFSILLRPYHPHIVGISQPR